MAVEAFLCKQTYCNISPDAHVHVIMLKITYNGYVHKNRRWQTNRSVKILTHVQTDKHPASENCMVTNKTVSTLHEYSLAHPHTHIQPY